MTSLKGYQVHERPLSGELRVVNDGELDRADGLEEEGSLEEVRVLYRAWMSIDWMAEGC